MSAVRGGARRPGAGLGLAGRSVTRAPHRVIFIYVYICIFIYYMYIYLHTYKSNYTNAHASGLSTQEHMAAAAAPHKLVLSTDITDN